MSKYAKRPSLQDAKPKPNFKKAPLVERLQIKLSQKQKDKLITWTDAQKNDIETSRSDFQERQEKYVYAWDDMVTDTRKGSWDGASNLNLPVTSIFVNSLHSRFYGIFTNDKTVQLVPRETSDQNYSWILAKLYNWFLFDYINGFKGIRGFTREVYHDCVTVGYGVGMKDWQLKQRKMIRVEPRQIKELEKEMQDLMPQMQELGEKKQVLETDEEMATQRIDLSPYKEAQKIVTVFEGPRLRSIPWENAYFPNNISESNDLDSPPYVMIETEMSQGAIALKAAQGVWNQEAADELIAREESGYKGDRASAVKQRRDNLSGYNDSHQERKSTIRYEFCTYDIDDDGFEEEIILTRSDKGDILNVNFLDRFSSSGMRPLYKFDCFSKPRQGYSRGVPELVWPIQQEINHAHNKRNDLLTIQTTPFGVFRGNSSLKKEPVKLSPGKLIPVDDTSDVRLMSWPVTATAWMGEEQSLWQMGERQSKVSSYNQGIVPDNVGPTRSTSGLVAVLKQIDKEFLPNVEQNAQQWKKLHLMLLHDLDLRIPAEMKLRVLGSSIKDPTEAIKEYGPESVADALLVCAQFDVKIDVASVINSEEVMRNDAQIIMQTILAPSLAQQTGVIGPKAFYKVISDYLYSYGRNPEDYIDQPEYTGKALTLFQEIQVCGQGMMPPMALQDDHMGKAQQLMSFIETPEFQQALAQGLYVRNTAEFVQKAAQKHAQLAQMMKPQGMPNPSGQNNQNLNEQQAGAAPQQKNERPDLASAEGFDTGGAMTEENGPA